MKNHLLKSALLVALLAVAAPNSAVAQKQASQQRPQCAATAKTTGQQCRNRAVDGSKYCGVHKQQPKANTPKANALTSGAATSSHQCKATTQKGTRCSRAAKFPDGLCAQHHNLKKK